MVYQLIYTKSAFKDIKKLDKVSKKKIKQKIEQYSVHPLTYARKLVRSSIGTHRWRAGNHRIIFDLDGKKIVILRIGHRREIYR